VIPSEIEPATFRLVAQCPNQPHHGVPHHYIDVCQIITSSVGRLRTKGFLKMALRTSACTIIKYLVLDSLDGAKLCLYLKHSLCPWQMWSQVPKCCACNHKVMGGRCQIQYCTSTVVNFSVLCIVRINDGTLQKQWRDPLLSLLYRRADKEKETSGQ